MTVYQTNPDAPPDAAFERGRIDHLVVGNRGRLLDPRRTPMTIVSIRPTVGTFVLCLDDFEDRGATWEIPFEHVDRYQFQLDSALASAADTAWMREAIAKFDRPLVIACDPPMREETNRRIAVKQADADDWLGARSRFLRNRRDLPDPETRRGDPTLCDDLLEFMTDCGLADLETAFARQYVSGPHSGELIKGHRIVFAELGLVPFHGTVLRDPSTFEGPWRRDRRAEHILARLAWVRSLLARLRTPHVVLYRGMSITGEIAPPRNQTFVSATFSRAVAESHFDCGNEASTRVLLRQWVSVHRLFMTYYETSAMNAQFLEAEAVLLFDETNRIF